MVIEANIYRDRIETSAPVNAETMKVLEVVAAYLKQ